MQFIGCLVILVVILTAAGMQHEANQLITFVLNLIGWGLAIYVTIRGAAAIINALPHIARFISEKIVVPLFLAIWRRLSSIKN